MPNRGEKKKNRRFLRSQQAKESTAKKLPNSPQRTLQDGQSTSDRSLSSSSPVPPQPSLDLLLLDDVDDDTQDESLSPPTSHKVRPSGRLMRALVSPWQQLLGGSQMRRSRHNSQHERTGLLDDIDPEMGPKGSSSLHYGGMDHSRNRPRVTLPPPQNPRALKHWAQLRHTIREGDFLLQANLMQPLVDKNVNNNSNSSSKAPHVTIDDDDKNYQPPHSPTNSPADLETLRLQVQSEIKSAMDFSLGSCVWAIVIYLGIAVVAFSFCLDRWSVIDSMYFAVVTFTTIGYGDITPTTTAGKVFTSFFALSGVAFLGIALGVLGNQLVEAHEKAVEQTGHLTQTRVLSVFSSSHDTTSTDEAQDSVWQTPASPSAVVDPVDATKQESVVWKMGRELAVIMVFILLFAFWIAAIDPGIPSQSLSNAFYFTVITATTVGYGDMSPHSPTGRLASILFIPLAVGAMGHFLSVVANAVVESRQESVRQKMLQTKELTLQDLEIMDSDGDGDVTRLEWLEFMLVAMNKVEPELLAALKQQFERLDMDGTGVLSRADLIAVARRKLQTPTRKLELYDYKQRLLAQGKASRHRGAMRTRSQSMLFRELPRWGSIFRATTQDDELNDESEKSVRSMFGVR